MASVYKFKRKNKNESEKVSAETLKEERTPFLVDDANLTPADPVTEETQEKDINETTSIFTPFEAKKADIPQDLLDSFVPEKADHEKLDAVFNHSIANSSSANAKEEFDKTTDLLKEIFGTTEKKKKKKKKDAEESVKTVEAEENSATETPSDSHSAEEYIADHGGHSRS